MAEAAVNPTDIASVFAALGDPTRLGLVSRLQNGQTQSISQLAEGFRLTRQAVTKHLRVLEHAGVVARERVGRESRYVLEPAAIDEARVYLDRASEQWDEAVARLRAFVEETDRSR